MTSSIFYDYDADFVLELKIKAKLRDLERYLLSKIPDDCELVHLENNYPDNTWDIVIKSKQ